MDFILPYTPEERQRLLHKTMARQIVYGGAAGGGKSTATRWDIVAFALRNPGFHGGLFRKTLPELRQTHINVLKSALPNEIAVWNEEQKKFYFVNKAVITMGFCEHEDDVERYLSEEFHYIGLDEGSRFTPKQIGFLKTRNRLGNWKATNKADALRLPRFVIATNPGGPSHSLIKRTVIDKAPAETIFYDETMRNPHKAEDKGWSTIFIPAKMTDNKYLDDDYGASFGGLAPELAKAYRDGDWDVVVGQAVHNLERKKHCIRQFVPPAHWTKFQVMDWGTAKPFSIGWYCVSEGAMLKAKYHHPVVYLPKGAIIRYNEMYGWNGKEDEGCKWSGPHVALKMQHFESELKERIDYRVADTEMWANRGGPSVISYFTDLGMTFRHSIKDRKRNYQEIVSRLAGNPEFIETGEVSETPMAYITENCIHFWRTVPILTLDKTDPDKGPDTKQEDHVYDEFAYACRSMPFVTTKEDRDDEEYYEALQQYGQTCADPYS
jgi:hypothetical protein